MVDHNEKAAAPLGPNGPRLSWARVLIAVGIGLVMAILYGIWTFDGKDGTIRTASTASCAASSDVAARIAPLATGELAALAVNRNPEPATNIAFAGPAGEPLSLNDFRGKMILLNLWATWCVPCRVEMPALDRLQQALGGEEFEVVAVNIDTSRLERRKTFLDSVGVTHLGFYTDEKADSFQVLKRHGKVLGLPTTFLIDAAGCELGRMAGPAEWDSEQAKNLIRLALGKNS